MATYMNSSYQTQSALPVGLETAANYYNRVGQSINNQNLQRDKLSLADTAANQAMFNLQKSQEAWDLKKKQAASSSKLASSFMSQWSSSLNDVKGMYGNVTNLINSAIKGFSSGGGSGSGGVKIPGFDNVIKTMQNSYNDYQTNFEPAAKKMLSSAAQEQDMRMGAAHRLDQYATPDYAGVRGRAASDVATKSEAARAALDRQLMSTGADPNSGKFGALTRKSYLDQAKNTAIAMNTASRGEKTRAANTSLAEMNALHPELTAGVATNILGTGQKMLGQQGALVKSAADVATAKMNANTARMNALGNMVNTAGNLATGYSNNVTQPLSEAAGYFLGQGGALPTA